MQADAEEILILDKSVMSGSAFTTTPNLLGKSNLLSLSLHPVTNRWTHICSHEVVTLHSYGCSTSNDGYYICALELIWFKHRYVLSLTADASR